MNNVTNDNVTNINVTNNNVTNNMMDEDEIAMKRNHESRLAKKQTFHCVESHYHAAQTVYTESEK